MKRSITQENSIYEDSPVFKRQNNKQNTNKEDKEQGDKKERKDPNNLIKILRQN